MTKSIKLVAALCCLWLAGCAGVAGGGASVNPYDAQAVYNSTTVAQDPYKNVKTINGPLIFADGFVMNDGYSAFITMEPGGVNIGHIFFAARFEEWASLDTAYSDGKKYPLGKINQKVEGCGRYVCHVTETVGLNLSIGQLRQLAKKDVFNIKLVGRTGEKAFAIPGTYFQALLKRLGDSANGYQAVKFKQFVSVKDHGINDYTFAADAILINDRQMDGVQFYCGPHTINNMAVHSCFVFEGDTMVIGYGSLFKEVRRDLAGKIIHIKTKP